MKVLSHTHIQADLFLILSQYLTKQVSEKVFTLVYLWVWFAKNVESSFLCLLQIYRLFFLLFQCDILEIDVSGWLNVMKQIKQTQPVLNMENSGHWAYLKSLKVKHQNGFEGYLILTGARSQLTTFIKPQYIALHMSGNPRFQYYSKPEWYFLRCWRNVRYPLFFFFTKVLFLCT